MNEMRRDRMKLVVLAVAAVAAIFGYLTFGRGGAADDVGATAPGTGAVSSRHLVEDERARLLLRDGRLAMESLFASSQSFSGGIAAAAQVEPNISWVSGDTASAAANQVALIVPSERSYVLSTTSASGETFTFHRTDTPRVERASAPGGDR